MYNLGILMSGDETDQVFEPARAMVFATLMAEFGNQTGLDLWLVREPGLSGTKPEGQDVGTVGLSHQQWGFFLFLFKNYPSPPSVASLNSL